MVNISPSMCSCVRVCASFIVHNLVQSCCPCSNSGGVRFALLHFWFCSFLFVWLFVVAIEKCCSYALRHCPIWFCFDRYNNLHLAFVDRFEAEFTCIVDYLFITCRSFILGFCGLFEITLRYILIFSRGAFLEFAYEPQDIMKNQIIYI